MTPSSGEGAGGGILFLDLEGGWGGSSRSLFHIVEAIDRDRFRPLVVLRKDGPVAERYRALGVRFEIMPELPAFRPAERKNAVSYGFYLWRARKLGKVVERLRALADEIDARLLYVNHESLATAGAAIARRMGLPWVAHIRTELKPGIFARRVYRTIAREASHVVFIAEPVADNFRKVAGCLPPEGNAEVLYNFTDARVAADLPAPEAMRDDAALRVVLLSNFSPNRGIDRVVDVAEAVARRGARDIRFYLFGRPAHANLLTGATDPYYASVVEKARAGGVDDIVVFPGHTSAPDAALASADVLIKLTRENNPWGRDIIEGLSAGRVVVTLGSYSAFIAHGENGYLREAFDPDDIAAFLVALRDDPALLAKIKEANAAKARRLFSREAAAARLHGIFTRVMAGTPRSNP